MSLLDQISCALPPVELWLGHCIISLCLSTCNGISNFLVRQCHRCGAAHMFVASFGASLAYSRLFHHIFLGTFAEVTRIILDRSSLCPSKELADENTDTSSSSWNHSAVSSDVGRLGWDLLSKTVVHLRRSAWFVTLFSWICSVYPFLSCNSDNNILACISTLLLAKALHLEKTFSWRCSWKVHDLCKAQGFITSLILLLRRSILWQTTSRTSGGIPNAFFGHAVATCDRVRIEVTRGCTCQVGNVQSNYWVHTMTDCPDKLVIEIEAVIYLSVGSWSSSKLWASHWWVSFTATFFSRWKIDGL